MTTPQALSTLRKLLNYYSVTHAAYCKSWDSTNHKKHLDGCDCDAGKAFRHIERKLTRRPR